MGLFAKRKDTITKVIDPVCGMRIDPSKAAATQEQQGGATVYFCSDHCAATFVGAQHTNTHRGAASGHHH